MKKILSLMLAMLLLLGTFAACSKDTTENGGTIAPVVNNENVFTAQGEHNDQFYYDYVNGDEVVITDFAASHVPHAIEIPAVIDDRPVTQIAEGAFKNKTNVTEVVLPESVVWIGEMAFANCTGLTKINFPAKLRYLGDAAFASTALTAAVVPSAAPAADEEAYEINVGEKVFYNCRQLVSATLPAELKVVPAQIFSDCVALTTVNWGAAIEKIGAHAFSGCAVLKNITIPATVTEIGDYAFAECKELEVPVLADTVKVGTNAFYNAKVETVPTVHTGSHYVYFDVVGMVYRDRICDDCGERVERTALSGAVVVTDTASAQAAIDAAVSDTVIYFRAGTYGELEFQSTKGEDFANVSLVAADGVTVDAIIINDTQDYAPKGLLIENIHFNSVDGFGGVDIEKRSITELTVRGCTFTGNANITVADGAVATDVVIENCSFANVATTDVTDLSAINMNRVVNLTVKDNSFDSIEYNALQVGGDQLSGTVTVVGNTFKDVQGRVLDFQGGVDVTAWDISGNTFYAKDCSTVDGTYVQDAGNYINVVGATVTVGSNVWETIPENTTLYFSSGVVYDAASQTEIGA